MAFSTSCKFSSIEKETGSAETIGPLYSKNSQQAILFCLRFVDMITLKGSWIESLTENGICVKEITREEYCLNYIDEPNEILRLKWSIEDLKTELINGIAQVFYSEIDFLPTGQYRISLNQGDSFTINSLANGELIKKFKWHSF